MKNLLLLSCAIILVACAFTSTPSTAASPVETTAPSPTATPIPQSKDTSLPSDNFSIGARISTQISPEQVDFVNQHYDFVMTPILSHAMRAAIHRPQLILYRSIQGTWTGFNHFDWEHINAHENMFEHHHSERILTIWNSWLMNADDLVNPTDPDALGHWINYYAVTASEQIYQYDYDGLFIDSASHRLGKSAVNGIMPDDYDAEEWRQGRVSSLAFIKSYLPDKSVVFNGLHSRAGAEDSLANTDGGM